MKDVDRERVADRLTGILDDARRLTAKEQIAYLQTRLSHVRSEAIQLDVFQYDDYLRSKLSTACEAVARCFGARNSKDSGRRSDALDQIHRVRSV